MSRVFFNAPLEFNDIFLSFETFLCPYNYCLIEFPKPKSTKLVQIIPIWWLGRWWCPMGYKKKNNGANKCTIYAWKCAKNSTFLNWSVFSLQPMKRIGNQIIQFHGKNFWFTVMSWLSDGAWLLSIGNKHFYNIKKSSKISWNNNTHDNTISRKEWHADFILPLGVMKTQ